MVTRFYFPLSGSPPGPVPPVATIWDVTSAATRRPLVLTKSNTAFGLQTGNADTVTTSPVNVFGSRQWISDPLTAQTISGTFSAVARVQEPNSAADATLQINIRVCNSSDAIVATLYAGHTAALNTTPGALGEELPVGGFASRIFNAVPISSYTCSAGDRIVVEWGVRNFNTVATSYAASHRYGDPIATADYALTSGQTTELCTWIEFSADLFNVQQEARIEAVNLEAVTKTVTPEHRVTAANLEAVLQSQKPEHRVTAVNLEAVIVRRPRPAQYEFWGQVEY